MTKQYIRPSVMMNALVTASLLLGHAHGFATVRQLTRPFTTPSVRSSLSFNEDGSNNDMTLILHQAVDCSSSDSCSVEQAEWYLSQVMSLQQECTIGDGDDDHDVGCDNPEAVSRIISQLQNKILHASMSVTKASEQQSSFATTVKTSPAIMAAGVVLTLALTAKVLTSNFGGEDTVAFTAEEWWWALRDN